MNEWVEARCPDCNKLLCKVLKSQDNWVEVLCHNCKVPRRFQGNYPVRLEEGPGGRLGRGVERVPAVG